MAEVIPELLPWLDAKKRAAVRGISDALAAPADTLWGALRAAGENAGVVETPEQAAESERLTHFMYAESPEGKASAKERIAQALMGFGSGGMGGSAALAGMLRPKGNPTLMLSHGVSNLEAAHGGTLKELMHPSMGITGHEEITNPFGTGSYKSLLIPKLGAFDPAYSTSTLFNRDAYVARKSDYPGGSNPTPAERVLTRGLMPPARSEGVEAFRSFPSDAPGWAEPDWATRMRGHGGSHDSAIQASPIFRSLAEYENSPKGAGTLVRGDAESAIQNWADKWTNDFRRWWNYDYGGPEPNDWMGTLREKALKGDRKAAKLIQDAQRAPSDYAELKVSGPVPLTGERFAGAILNPSHYAQHADTLMARGIPSVERRGYNTPESEFQTADAMQRLAGAVKERSLRVKAGWEPSQTVPTRQIYVEPSGRQQSFNPTGSTPAGAWPKSNFDAALKAGDIHQDPSALATAKLKFKNGGGEFQEEGGQLLKVDDQGNVHIIDEITGDPIKAMGNIHTPPVAEPSPILHAKALDAWSPSSSQMFKHGGAKYFVKPEGGIIDEWGSSHGNIPPASMMGAKPAPPATKSDFGPLFTSKAQASHSSGKIATFEYNGSQYHVLPDGTVFSSEGVELGSMGPKPPASPFAGKDVAGVYSAGGMTPVEAYHALWSKIGGSKPQKLTIDEKELMHAMEEEAIGKGKIIPWSTFNDIEAEQGVAGLKKALEPLFGDFGMKP